MNDLFEIKRFGLLLKKTVAERVLQLTGLAALALIATLIIYAGVLFVTDGAGHNLAQNLSFVWGIIGGGTFLSSIVFGYFSTNASGAAYLTLPASAFEKWLCGILIIGVFFPVVFMAFYRVMDTCFVMFYHNGLNKHDPRYTDMYNAVQVYAFDNNFAKQCVIIYANFATAMMVGSLYFNKVSAVKTALVYVGLLAFVYFLNLILAHTIFTHVDSAFPFNSIFIKVGNGTGLLELPAMVSKMVFIAIQYIIPGALLFTTYIRLREKEI
jgi:hypothetical protein